MQMNCRRGIESEERRHQNRGVPRLSGRGMTGTCLLVMRCPVYRRRESHLGSGMELENLVGDDKGKGTSGGTARPKVPMHRSGADCPVVARKRSNDRRAKGAGYSHCG